MTGSKNVVLDGDKRNFIMIILGGDKPLPIPTPLEKLLNITPTLTSANTPSTQTMTERFELWT